MPAYPRLLGSPLGCGVCRVLCSIRGKLATSMHELLNVLYVLTQGAMLHLDHDTVRVEVERQTRLRAPLLRLSGIVVFGQIMLSPFLIQRCAEDGRNLVWLDRRGRFKARVEGATRGNVLLRRAQHLALSDP